MATNVLFFIAFSFLLAHEMDAVRRHEWRVLPLLSSIADDRRGYGIFIAIHVPLYALLLWGLWGDNGVINQPLVIGLDIFCMVHVLLHLLFMRHPQYQFNNPFSWSLILGAGVAGGVDLVFRF